MTHTYGKGEGQLSLGKKLPWKQTDGQTEAISLPPALTWLGIIDDVLYHTTSINTLDEISRKQLQQFIDDNDRK